MGCQEVNRVIHNIAGNQTGSMSKFMLPAYQRALFIQLDSNRGHSTRKRVPQDRQNRSLPLARLPHWWQ